MKNSPRYWTVFLEFLSAKGMLKVVSGEETLQYFCHPPREAILTTKRILSVPYLSAIFSWWSCISFVWVLWASLARRKQSKTLLGNRLENWPVSRKASQRYLSSVVSFLSFRVIWLVECCMWNYLSQWKCPIYLWESTWIESLFNTVLLISWQKTCPLWLSQIPISCLHKDCHVCSNASWIYLVRQTEIRASRSSLSEISRGNFLCLAVTWVASKGTWYLYFIWTIFVHVLYMIQQNKR